ncbi:hypothetical protein [Pseudactinotalea suaedae]|uniref:hypothetical protein n=1 Tax=Pseudactinotalea suaedae TaxID=1524924 RepID=UPI0012E17456|nr:hypothetical protein [Pseudactinotalea suaedae]
MPYTADRPDPAPSAEELRRRIPGWGADLDPADRPSYPKERDDVVTGAHWVLPERQQEREPRERSIEHGMLTPVFGTAQPLHGPAGAIRRYAYERYSEARAAHWLLLMLGDRVDSALSGLQAVPSRGPAALVGGTGLIKQLRSGRMLQPRDPRRADNAHVWMDPLVLAAPWLAGAWITWRVVRGVRRRR